MLATITGVVVLLFIFFLVFVSMVSNASKGDKVVVDDNSILHLKLNYSLVDRSNDNPFDELASGLAGDVSTPVGLHDMLNCIEEAKTDDKIKGIFIDLTAIGAGYAKLTELRDAVNDFKSTGKFVYSYGEIFYNQTYYFASVADKVYLNPSGTMLFNGMAADVTFMKETLAKLGIEMQVIKRGKFKGAVEPFVLDGLSDENRKQISVYLESIYGQFLDNISDSRSLSVEQLKEIANGVKVKSGEDAVKYNMIDAVGYRDEVMTAMASELGLEEGKEPNLISLAKYNKGRKMDMAKTSKNVIAVVYADGDIVSGKGQTNEIGSDRFAKALAQAREDDNVKAVVLRINSGGGSALASDVIWRETKLLREQKPLIVSMGDVAASGGYFIDCMGDSVLAMPNTITGSIGVFGLYPNAEGLYNKMGLKTEVVKTADVADFGRIDRPLTSAEMDILDALIKGVYEQFRSRVEEGRNLDRAHIDTIAEGRVWTGEYAKKHGLIDAFGGIQDAVNIAASKAGVEEYRLSAYPKSDNPFEEFFTGFGMASIKDKVLKEELGSYYTVYNKLQRLQSLRGIQAIMPYQIELN